MASKPARRPLSLALRITLVAGLAMSGLFVAFTALVERSLQMHFAEQDLGEVMAVAQSLSDALAPQPAAEAQQDLPGRLSRAVAGHHGVYFSVHDAQGEPLFGTAPPGLYQQASAQPASTMLAPDALRIWQAGDQFYRGALLAIRGETVLVAVAMAPHLRYLALLRRGLWGGTLLACVVAVLAAWLAVRWGHAPLRRVSATVRSVSAEQLHVRLDPTELPPELAPLAAAFNAMLDQLQDSFSRLSHFSSDIAHELRTPVTNLSTQTQVALSQPRDAAAYREVLYSSLEELDRLAKMISDMLYLAQADHRLAPPELTELDLAVEIAALFDYFEAWAEEAGVGLVLRGHAPAIQGNRAMLRRAISNLIANALRYTPRGQALTLGLEQVDDAVFLSVENPGPDIDASNLPKLFDRFFRADPSRQHKTEGEGAGLGLAIVKAIAQAHGGSVSVRSGGGKTCFTLRLPRTGARP